MIYAFNHCNSRGNKTQWVWPTDDYYYKKKKEKRKKKKKEDLHAIHLNPPLFNLQFLSTFLGLTRFTFNVSMCIHILLLSYGNNNKFYAYFGVMKLAKAMRPPYPISNSRVI